MNNPDRTAQQEPRFIALHDLPTPALPISQRLARRLRYQRRVPTYKVGGRILFAELRQLVE